MIHDIIGKPAAYEALAEEATELAKAALKMARVLRGENPTPVTEEEARKELIEEITDVAILMADLGIMPDEKLGHEKIKRFWERQKEFTGKRGATGGGFGEMIARALFAGIMTDLMKDMAKDDGKGKDTKSFLDESDPNDFMSTWFSGFDFPDDKEDDDE